MFEFVFPFCKSWAVGLFHVCRFGFGGLNFWFSIFAFVFWMLHFLILGVGFLNVVFFNFGAGFFLGFSMLG